MGRRVCGATSSREISRYVPASGRVYYTTTRTRQGPYSGNALVTQTNKHTPLFGVQVRFVMVGDGEIRDDLERFASLLGLGKDVLTFTGCAQC